MSRTKQLEQGLTSACALGTPLLCRGSFGPPCSRGMLAAEAHVGHAWEGIRQVSRPVDADRFSARTSCYLHDRGARR